MPAGAAAILASSYNPQGFPEGFLFLKGWKTMLRGARGAAGAAAGIWRTLARPGSLSATSVAAPLGAAATACFSPESTLALLSVR